MEMNYCRRCGSKLQNTHENEYKCASGHFVYSNPSPTVGIFLITKSGDIVMAVRGIEPSKGMLDTPGGFIDAGESLEEGLARELDEELGLQPSEYSKPKFLTSAPGRYEIQAESSPVITTFFWADLLTDRVLTPADDVADVKILRLSNINPDELSNDDIRLGIKELQAVLS